MGDAPGPARSRCGRGRDAGDVSCPGAEDKRKLVGEVRVRFRGDFPAGLALLGLALWAVPAGAQQKLAVVNPGLVYLPQSGVALEAGNGQVKWRTPRYGSRVLSDGHGLLIVSYLAVVQKDSLENRYRWTRYCRLRAATGRRAWCATALDASGAALSADGQYLYVQEPRRVEVYAASNGRHLRGAGTPDGEMMPLANNGVAVFSPRPHHSRLWSFSLTMKQAVVREFTRPLFAFHGPGAGVLWYAPRSRRFVGGLEATPSLPPAASAPGSFPEAQTDRWGFAVSQNDGRHWLLSGGSYHGAVWTRRLPAQPRLRLRGKTVLAWWLTAGGTEVSAFGLQRGKMRFERRIPVQVNAALVDGGTGATGQRGIVLFGAQSVLWLDPSTGRIGWWRDVAVDGPAALTGPAVLAWDGGNLVAFNRHNGAVLWRVRFRLR